MTPSVAAVFEQMPETARDVAHALRALIFKTAEDTQTGPLTETLKWGQVSYLTEATKSGTTIRLAYSDKHKDFLGLYVHCQTNLVDSYRQRFPTEFVYQSNRAVLISTLGPIPKDALSQVIAMALSYHRNKD